MQLLEAQKAAFQQIFKEIDSDDSDFVTLQELQVGESDGYGFGYGYGWMNVVVVVVVAVVVDDDDDDEEDEILCWWSMMMYDYDYVCFCCLQNS